MKLINGYDLLNLARERELVLPAFNTTNLETTYGIARGLEDARLPGFIQISSNNLRLSNPAIIAEIARAATQGLETPIGLHLDHGKSFEDVKLCIEAGFTSVMVDASHLPFEENVQEVSRAVEYCHYYGIPVEAELGAISGKEDNHAVESELKTNPDMVAEFVKLTGCDLLAVSVGNVHGLSCEPKIDLPLLQKIQAVCPVPLVLHGGSGIPKEVIWAAKEFGLIKINYGSDLRKAYISTFGQAFEQDRNAHDLYSLSVAATENVRNKACEIVTMINQRQ